MLFCRFLAHMRTSSFHILLGIFIKLQTEYLNTTTSISKSLPQRKLHFLATQVIDRLCFIIYSNNVLPNHTMYYQTTQCTTKPHNVLPNHIMYYQTTQCTTKPHNVLPNHTVYDQTTQCNNYAMYKQTTH